jgi:uncharacterized membrane protein
MGHHDQATETKGTSRIEAFSDGVFAIAITLLVLDLIQMLHALPAQGGLEGLFHHWQPYFAFTVGFVTILVCWINHHVALEYMEKVDTGFLWVNGTLLFLVTITPFTTAILAEYLGEEPRAAMAIYAINYVLISISADAICSYAYARHLVREGSRDFYRHYKKIYRYAIFYNLLALLCCSFSILIPQVMFAVLFLVFSSPKSVARWIQHRSKTGRRMK